MGNLLRHTRTLDLPASRQLASRDGPRPQSGARGAEVNYPNPAPRVLLLPERASLFSLPGRRVYMRNTNMIMIRRGGGGGYDSEDDDDNGAADRKRIACIVFTRREKLLWGRQPEESLFHTTPPSNVHIPTHASAAKQPVGQC